MNDEITLKNTKSVILRLWSTVLPEASKFGTVKSIARCCQQPDLFRLSGGKKKTAIFSTKSFQVVPQNETPSRGRDWQPVD